jgi:hypothetical protein
MADCPAESSRSSRLYDSSDDFPPSASDSQQDLVTMTSDTKDVEIPAEIRKLSTQQDNAEEVREAVELEHTLTFWEAVKFYPKAIGWSMYFSLGVIMLCKSIYSPATRIKDLRF